MITHDLQYNLYTDLKNQTKIIIKIKHDKLQDLNKKLIWKMKLDGCTLMNFIQLKELILLVL